MIDSTKYATKPFKFSLGNGDVIKGWDEAFKGISKGEKCTLVCGYDFA